MDAGPVQQAAERAACMPGHAGTVSLSHAQMKTSNEKPHTRVPSAASNAQPHIPRIPLSRTLHSITDALASIKGRRRLLAFSSKAQLCVCVSLSHTASLFLSPLRNPLWSNPDCPDCPLLPAPSATRCTTGAGGRDSAATYRIEIERERERKGVKE